MDNKRKKEKAAPWWVLWKDTHFIFPKKLLSEALLGYFYPFCWFLQMSKFGYNLFNKQVGWLKRGSLLDFPACLFLWKCLSFVSTGIRSTSTRFWEPLVFLSETTLKWYHQSRQLWVRKKILREISFITGNYPTLLCPHKWWALECSKKCKISVLCLSP